jgi:hypothetical protein
MLPRWHKFRLSRSCSDRLCSAVADNSDIRWPFGVGLPLVILSIVCIGALGTGPQKREAEWMTRNCAAN